MILGMDDVVRYRNSLARRVPAYWAGGLLVAHWALARASAQSNPDLAVDPRSGNRGATADSRFVRRELVLRRFAQRSAELGWVLLSQEVQHALIGVAGRGGLPVH